MNRSSYTHNSTYNKKNRSSGNRFLSFLLKYALPFIIINGVIFYLVTNKPKLITEVGSTDDYRTTNISIVLNSFLPVRSITASMDGQDILLEKGSKNRYTAEIEKNGVLEINAVSFNGMTATIFESIDVLDDNPPAITNHSIDEGVLTFSLEDSQSGIDYSSIHAVNSKGDETMPLTMDKVKGTISFTMDPDGLIIYIKDLSGHEIQATFTSHMENGKEVSETSSEEVNNGETEPPTEAPTAQQS